METAITSFMENMTPSSLLEWQRELFYHLRDNRASGVEVAVAHWRGVLGKVLLAIPQQLCELVEQLGGPQEARLAYTLVKSGEVTKTNAHTNERWVKRGSPSGSESTSIVSPSPKRRRRGSCDENGTTKETDRVRHEPSPEV
eukprot:scaffold1362_cov163-Amphora_coffeaeformis.AAC.2